MVATADQEPSIRTGGTLPLERDAYADLLRDTRGLRREHAQAREAWLHRLPLDKKDEVLFELEVLLKGLACFANPRNHPGPPKRTPVVAQDFREPTCLAREGMARIASLTRTLLLERDRAFVFQRYLETVLPDEGTRTRLARETLAQGTPEESLTVLRHGMTNFVELAQGLARLPRVPFRLFYALLGSAQREVLASAHFNPLTALEFRPEFDRITSPHILELMHSVPGEQGRRIVALTFLSLFRMLRYVALAEERVRDGDDAPRRSAGIVYLVLSVLRSDARALTGYLRQRAGTLLGDGFERELFRVPARELASRYDALVAEGHRLLEIKATLEGVSGNLRLELRRAFEHDFPAPDLAPTMDALRPATRHLAATLRPALQNAILVLGKALGTRLDEHGVFDDAAARRSLSERLRRDVWMFAQIVRAFAQKARAVSTNGDERWSGVSSLQFVREFLVYFRAMGYPLLRAADYPRFDAYLSAMAALEESELVEPSRLNQATVESEQFYEFLTALFDQIGRRVELAAIPFDRRDAAGSLKLYLGD
jgi:hypothetical protein